jgi:hypothetical protein
MRGVVEAKGQRTGARDTGGVGAYTATCAVTHPRQPYAGKPHWAGGVLPLQELSCCDCSRRHEAAVPGCPL